MMKFDRFAQPAAAVLAALCLAATSAVAQTKGPVASDLTVQRIAVGADGKEAKEPAGSAKPGDILEYAVEYRNTSKAPVRKLEATLPIPFGTEFLPGTGAPAGAQASVDGTVFAPMPLKRMVRQPDGKDLEQRVSLAEYRYLRWPAQDLAAGASVKAAARVRVATDSAAPGDSTSSRAPQRTP